MHRRYGGHFQLGTTDRHDVHRHAAGVLDRVHMRAGAAVQERVGRGVRHPGHRRGRDQQFLRGVRQVDRQVLQPVQHQVRQRADGERGHHRHDVLQYVSAARSPRNNKSDIILLLLFYYYFCYAHDKRFLDSEQNDDLYLGEH